jgi:hypothetical protein
MSGGTVRLKIGRPAPCASILAAAALAGATLLAAFDEAGARSDRDGWRGDRAQSRAGA